MYIFVVFVFVFIWFTSQFACIYTVGLVSTSRNSPLGNEPTSASFSATVCKFSQHNGNDPFYLRRKGAELQWYLHDNKNDGLAQCAWEQSNYLFTYTLAPSQCIVFALIVCICIKEFRWCFFFFHFVCSSSVRWRFVQFFLFWFDVRDTIRIILRCCCSRKAKENQIKYYSVERQQEVEWLSEKSAWMWMKYDAIKQADRQMGRKKRRGLDMKSNRCVER